MNLVENSVSLIDIKEPGRKIEYAGRVCYKSQDKISDESYERFIKGIVKRGHTSVLEHERQMFAFPRYLWDKEVKHIFEWKKYFSVSSEEDTYFVSGNIRAWYELCTNSDNETVKKFSSYLAKDYPYIFEDFGVKFETCRYGKQAEEMCKNLDPHLAYTFEIVGTRSFTHQIVRHRTLSFSQESQRYCNYNMDKFGNSLKFIKSEIPEGAIEHLKTVEKMYFNLIELGNKPEDARQILPNCTASTIVVTGTISDWRKFLKLRIDSHAQKEIREIATEVAKSLNILEEFKGEKDE